MPIADDHFGIGAHVHQHHHIVSLVHANGQEVGGDVRSHVTADQRTAVNVGVGVYPQVQVSRSHVQGGGGPLALVEFYLG